MLTPFLDICIDLKWHKIQISIRRAWMHVHTHTHTHTNLDISKQLSAAPWAPWGNITQHLRRPLITDSIHILAYTARHFASSISIRNRCKPHRKHSHRGRTFLTTLVFNTKTQIFKMATYLKKTRQAGPKRKKEKLRSRDRVTNSCPAMDESFRNVRQRENRPEIEINKFIRLHRLFVLQPSPADIHSNTRKNRDETRFDLCPLTKHSIYLALIAAAIWRSSYTLITPQDNSKTRQGLTKEWQPKEKRKWNKGKCIWNPLDVHSLFSLCTCSQCWNIRGSEETFAWLVFCSRLSCSSL